MITLTAMGIVGYLVWPYGWFPTVVAVLVTWKVVDFLGVLIIGGIASRGEIFHD